jgi:hypothetical protein
MRYYVLQQPEFEEFGPYIIGVALSDSKEGSEFLDEDAIKVDGPIGHLAALDEFDPEQWPNLRVVLSREELCATEEGRRALAAWDAGDDSAFEADNTLAVRQGRREDVLKDAEEGNQEAIALVAAGLPDEEVRRYALKKYHGITV